jgi:hypothetical protein
MELDEMQQLWNLERDTEPRIDAAALEQRVAREARNAEHGASVSEIGLMAIMGGTGAIMAADAFLDGEHWHNHANALALVGVAVYMFVVRRRRLRRLPAYDRGLTGYLDRGIANMDEQAAVARRFVWWCVLPSLATAALSMYYTFDHRPVWVWFAQPVALAVAWIVVQVGLRRQTLPQRDRLVALRDQLLAR